MKRFSFHFLLFCGFLLWNGCSSNDNENTDSTEQLNENANDYAIPYATGLEMPRMDGRNYFLARTTILNRKTISTYNMEYNSGKKHSRWVAFTFQTDTRSTEWKRANWESTKWGGDPFQADPDIAATDRTELADYYGERPYVRGHLLASYDRVYSKDANEQTFYLSNITPMLSSFNSGDGSRWNDMESQIQAWGRNPVFCDTLFVVKGGTIRDDQIADGTQNYLPLQKNGLTVPKYYFSAVLCKKVSNRQSSYKAIAFWFEHRPVLTGNLKEYVMTVNELEEKTGIDFFCNLPDLLEESVEGSVNFASWGL